MIYDSKSRMKYVWEIKSFEKYGLNVSARVWKMEALHKMDLCLLYIDVSLCQPYTYKTFNSDGLSRCHMDTAWY